MSESFLMNKPLLIGLLVLFGLSLILIQLKFPLVKHKQNLKKRLLVNSSMALLTYITASLTVRPSILFAFDFNWGVLNFLPSLPSVQFVAGFLLMDVTFYYWHRLNHKINFLWRFHNIHHIDQDMDASTGFRFHLAEVAISSIFRFLQMLLIGPTLLVFLSYEFVFQMATLFHHSNIRLPLTIDNSLKFFIVTPRMHEMHHSQFRNETDSNYSVVFSFWDRIHNTFTENANFKKVVIGVPGYMSPEDNRIKNLLLMPFKKQKNYWKGQISRPD